MSGEESDQTRKSSGVEDGSDAVVDAAGEAAERGGRLDNEVGVGVGECGGDDGDGPKLDVGVLLRSVSDDVVLHLADGFEFHRAIGRGEAVKDWIGGYGRCRHGGGDCQRRR